MPVPDYETLMLPVLALFGAGAGNVSECLPALKQKYAITEEEAQELLPSGRITYLASRAHWARTYLSKAGLLASPKRNIHVITDAGRALLAASPVRLDSESLEKFASFREWKSKPQASASSGDGTLLHVPSIDDNQTPEDAIEAAHAILHASLRDDLLQVLLELSPQRFERLILDLLCAMGYGGGQPASTMMTKTTGDGGIDGIVNEDALGLDAVYIQAKRYALDSKVGRPDIQKFVGSLTGESATKGVFVTTSSYSNEAKEYIKKVQHRIVLMDGQQLAQLMIRHGVGVRSRATYVISSIDEDYFADPVS